MRPKRSDILFLPLDVPALPGKDEILSAFGEGERYVWWNEETLLGEKDPSKPFGTSEAPWSRRALSHYRALVDHIERHLPFSSLVYVRLARALQPIPPHVDENYEVPPFAHHMPAAPEFIAHLKSLEPVGYRFLVSGSRDTLYLAEKYDPAYRDLNPGRKTYCRIPDQTDFFLIHNSVHPHGVDTNDRDGDRLVGFILGYLDPQKHEELVTRSYERFKPFAITNTDVSHEAAYV